MATIAGVAQRLQRIGAPHMEKDATLTGIDSTIVRAVGWNARAGEMRDRAVACLAGVVSKHAGCVAALKGACATIVQTGVPIVDRAAPNSNGEFAYGGFV